jgi:hypothetical protein
MLCYFDNKKEMIENLAKLGDGLDKSPPVMVVETRQLGKNRGKYSAQLS